MVCPLQTAFKSQPLHWSASLSAANNLSASFLHLLACLCRDLVTDSDDWYHQHKASSEVLCKLWHHHQHHLWERSLKGGQEVQGDTEMGVYIILGKINIYKYEFIYHSLLWIYLHLLLLNDDALRGWLWGQTCALLSLSCRDLLWLRYIHVVILKSNNSLDCVEQKETILCHFITHVRLGSFSLGQVWLDALFCPPNVTNHF